LAKREKELAYMQSPFSVGIWQVRVKSVAWGRSRAFLRCPPPELRTNCTSSSQRRLDVVSCNLELIDSMPAGTQHRLGLQLRADQIIVLPVITPAGKDSSSHEQTPLEPRPGASRKKKSRKLSPNAPLGE